MSGTVDLCKSDTGFVHRLVVSHKLLPHRCKLPAMVAIRREMLNKPVPFCQTLPSGIHSIALPDAICNGLVKVVRGENEKFDALDGQCARGQRERGEEQAKRKFSEHVDGESHAGGCPS